MNRQPLSPKPLSSTFSKPNPWTQYQSLRLTRIQQQHQQMYNMKSVIQKYVQLIYQYNSSLTTQNQHLRTQLLQFQSSPNLQLTLQLQLQKQQSLRHNLQNTIQHLKQQISLLTANHYNQDNFIIQYETLKNRYQNLKRQVYLLTQQNNQLKNTISIQQKLYADRKHFWLSNSPTTTPSQNPSIHNNTNTSSTKPKKLNHNQQSCVTFSDLKISNINTNNDKTKIKQLKNEINKLYTLIDKFKKNEQQQLSLIQTLKQTKKKVCLCHLYGNKHTQKNIPIKQHQNKYLNQNNTKLHN